MAWIQAYGEEENKFPNIGKEKLNTEHAERIIRKLSRHFKLGINYVEFRNRRIAHAQKEYERILLPYDSDCLLVAHEVNHFLIWKKYQSRSVNHGSKKWFTCLSRIIKYCEKNNWWKEEFEKIERQKEETIEREFARENYKKTPQYKFELILKSIKRWESKKRRAENMLKKLGRRRKIWEKKLGNTNI